MLTSLLMSAGPSYAGIVSKTAAGAPAVAAADMYIIAAAADFKLCDQFRTSLGALGVLQEGSAGGGARQN
jgi:hypothetical protein